jgi:putative serine protease PepD
VVMASALSGAVLASALLFAFNGFDSTTVRVTERVALTPVVAATDSNAPTEQWAQSVSAATLDSLVMVQVDGPSGSRSGSGVVFLDDGHVLTTAGLIGASHDVSVRVGDLVHVAHVVGTDAATDVAVLLISDHLGLPPAVLAPRPVMASGALVAIVSARWSGSPNTSATTVRAVDVTAQIGGESVPALLELASSSPASAQGGAVVDASGAVVALASAPTDRRDTGYATPIDIVKRVADELIANGKASHAWLGVVGSSMTPERAESTGIDAGAVVDEVAPSSPAAAVLHSGDVIVSLNGRTVRSMTDIVSTLRRCRSDATVTIAYVHDGVSHSGAITLQAHS